ncbi:RNA recognition motif-containing protein [Filimonas zeae]|uniref:RRM domain-containing protein n=1 Tax=Filimonas zeae TaxID=1737353 RepID=A0A917IRD3_9BACT|nr:RNA-binding protein [Filimonas zeae]MDR6337966.1 RNA recognition motif-containing protein [Filimonas zeae]GGH61074.1 hypothetical protein GCM10011379_09670 [Filimonas zeae]
MVQFNETIENYTIEGVGGLYNFCYLWGIRFTMRLSVSALPAHYNKYDLQRLFSPFGWVSYAKVFQDPITMKSTRKGVVELEDDNQARAAMEALNGKLIGPHPLNIKEKKENNPPR